MGAQRDDSRRDWRRFDLSAPTPEHALLAETLREFVAREVEPQAAEHDRERGASTSRSSGAPASSGCSA